VCEHSYCDLPLWALPIHHGISRPSNEAMCLSKRVLHTFLEEVTLALCKSFALLLKLPRALIAEAQAPSTTQTAGGAPLSHS
jgi:hypothetical protein